MAMDQPGPIILSMWRQEGWSHKVQEAEDAEAADRAQRILDAKARMEAAEAEQEDEEAKDNEAKYWLLTPQTRALRDAQRGPTTCSISLEEARQRLRRINRDNETTGTEKWRFRGCFFPKRFIPPKQSTTPLDLFSGTNSNNGDAQRYAHRDDPKTILVFTDGACLNNGKANPMAGWAVHHGPGTPEWPRLWLDRLETKGPFGDLAPQTSNRAELRAVVAAVRTRNWRIGRYRGLVIATDSKYVTEGATKWAKSWIRNDWKTTAGEPVINKDLWQLFLGEVENMAQEGLVVQIWKIPRDWNTYADDAARKAAAWETVPSEWMDM